MPRVDVLLGVFAVFSSNPGVRWSWGLSGKRRNPNYCLFFLPALGERGPYTPRRHCAIQARSMCKGSRGSSLDSTSWDLNSLTLSFPICKVGIIIAGYILLKWFKDFHELFFSDCSPTQTGRESVVLRTNLGPGSESV